LKLFLVTLALISLALLGMAVGVLVAGKRLKGSCGGLSAAMNADGERICGICGQEVGAIDPGSCEQGVAATGPRS
jgi:hypothetical protein